MNKSWEHADCVYLLLTSKIKYLAFRMLIKNNKAEHG
jgi:hypothetical protein